MLHCTKGRLEYLKTLTDDIYEGERDYGKNTDPNFMLDMAKLHNQIEIIIRKYCK